MGVNYSSNDKTMAQTTNRLISYDPATSSNVCKFYCKGQIIAFDLVSALVLFLGEHAGFEPYTKVGVIVPVHGTLDIETSREYRTFVGANQVAKTEVFSKDVVEPNPTLGFILCQR
jgi:hypothetical protein